MSAPGKVDERTFGGVTIYTAPLPPLDAIDLAPEILAAIGPAGAATFGDGAHLGDALAMVASALAGGKLRTLLPRLLAGSTMWVQGEAKVDLSGGVDVINRALTLRPDMLVPLVATALEVQFKRFFPGFDLVGLSIPTLSRSGDSSPSTSGTGSSTG